MLTNLDIITSHKSNNPFLDRDCAILEKLCSDPDNEEKKKLYSTAALHLQFLFFKKRIGFLPYDLHPDDPYKGYVLRKLKIMEDKSKYRDRIRSVDHSAFKDLRRPLTRSIHHKGSIKEEESSNINLLLLDEEEEKINYKDPALFFGTQARDKFWSLFKDSRTFKDQNEDKELHDPRFAYLKTCKEHNILPKAGFIIGDEDSSFKKEFNCANKGINPKTLEAVAKAIKIYKLPISSFNFQNNNLGPNECCVLLDSLVSHYSSIENLNISTNRIALKGSQKLNSIIGNLKKLRELNLSNGALGDEGAINVIRAISDSSSRGLRILRLSNNFLGKSRSGRELAEEFSGMVKRLIYSVIIFKSLNDVDLSWNNFGGILGKIIILSFCDSTSIKKLNLAYNIFGGDISKKEEPAVNELAELLILNKSIEYIDISFNNVEASSILCISYGIQCSSSLKGLNLNGNPIGSQGNRYLLNAIKENKKKQFNSYSADDIGMSILSVPILPTFYNTTSFDPLNPEKEYILDLSIAHERTILRKLLDIARSIAYQTKGLTQEAQCFHLAKLDNKAWKFPVEDGYGNWEIECDSDYMFKGILKFNFTLKHIKQLLVPGGELNNEEIELNLNDMLANCQRNVTAMNMPSPSKKVPLNKILVKEDFVTYIELLLKERDRNDDEHQYDILQNICNEYHLWSSQAVEMLNTFKQGTWKEKSAASLFNKIIDRHLKYCVLQPFKYQGAINILNSLEKSFDFTILNPTGHYQLDLAKEFERDMASELIKLNEKVKRFMELNTLFDHSKMGNKSCFRNETYRTESFLYSNEWKLPYTGIFEFDFVFLFDSLNAESPLEDHEFNVFFKFLKKVAVPVYQKIKIFRTISDQIWLKTSQLKDIIDLHEETEWKTGTYLIGIGRIVDCKNYDFIKQIIQSQGMTVLLFISSEGMTYLYKAFGILNLFNPFHPNGVYELKMNLYEEKIVLQILLELARKEGTKNLSNVSLNGKLIDPNESLFKTPIPKEGTIELTYFCTPEEEKPQVREDIGKKYLNWAQLNE